MVDRKYVGPADYIAHTSPEGAGRHIDRPRVEVIVDSLLSGDQQGIAVWSAAGSGKTVLLRSWQRRLAAAGVETVWFDGRDLSDRSTMAGIRSAFDSPYQNRSVRAGGTLRRVFLIDDVHEAGHGRGHDTLARIIAELPGDIGLIMAGRYQPQSSRSQRQDAARRFGELRTHDLSFDHNETLDLLTAHGCTVDEKTIGLLLRRTGGWAAALALAAPWLSGTKDKSKAVAQFDGDHRAVADYLVSEVLDLLRPDELAVLMRTAIRPVIPAEMLPELTKVPDAGAILHRIAQNISLVTIDPGGYRFHPVLLSYLQAVSRRNDAAAWAASHTAAYRWFAANGQWNNALEEAAASAVEADVLQGIDRFGLELVLMGEAESILRVISAIPRSGSALHLVATRLLLETPDFGDGYRAKHLFEMAMRLGDESGPTTSRWMAIVWALNCFRMAPEATTKQSLDRLRQPDISALRAGEFGLDLLAEVAEAWCVGQLGEPERAMETLREVAASSHRAGFVWLFFVAMELAVRLATSNGNWGLAATFEDQIASEFFATPPPPSNMVRAMATVTTAAQAFRRCEEMPLDSLEEIIDTESNGSLLGLSVVARGLINSRQLDSEVNARVPFEKVHQLMEQYLRRYPRLFASVGLRMVSLAMQLDGRGAAVEIAEFFRRSVGSDCLEAETVRLATSMPTAANTSLDKQLLAAVSQGGRALHSGAPVAAWLLLARFAQDHGRHSEADFRVQQALRTAQTNGSFQPFAARNGEGARLLEDRAGRLGHFEGLGLSIRMKVATVLPADATTLLGFENLTPRERDILKELPFHQSMAEIAAHQSLSLNTVKTHMRSIYQKLGTQDRSAAVTIARRFGLI